MTKITTEVLGLKELQQAIDRSPDVAKREFSNFLVRGIAAYMSVIGRNPWRKGMQGGGAPVNTGHLRDTHTRQISTYQGVIRPTAPYAAYVHGIEGMARKRNYQLRPYLDYAKQEADPTIQKLEGDLLDKLIHNLAT